MSCETVEDEASLALVLSDKISEIVRDHLSRALNDPKFVSELRTDLLAKLMVQGMQFNPDFRNAVKQVMIQSLQNSY